jgi:RNA polymerase sigma factor (TIGR02999 family)
MSIASKHDVTRLLEAVEKGEPKAAAELLPLVYDELRRLAAQKMAEERVGQTLSATGLVHEAYLRLAGGQSFANRRHFFAAAAESMRRILVDGARRKRAARHGGKFRRITLERLDEIAESTDGLIAVDEALEQLASESPTHAELVRLRFFAGMTTAEAAEILGVSLATAERRWIFARTWLYLRLIDSVAQKNS